MKKLCTHRWAFLVAWLKAINHNNYAHRCGAFFVVFHLFCVCETKSPRRGALLNVFPQVKLEPCTTQWLLVKSPKNYKHDFKFIRMLRRTGPIILQRAGQVTSTTRDWCHSQALSRHRVQACEGYWFGRAVTASRLVFKSGEAFKVSQKKINTMSKPNTGGIREQGLSFQSFWPSVVSFTVSLGSELILAINCC